MTDETTKLGWILQDATYLRGFFPNGMRVTEDNMPRIIEGVSNTNYRIIEDASL